MDCQAVSALQVRQATEFATKVMVWVFIFLPIVGVSMTALAQDQHHQPDDSRARHVLEKAMDYQMQFRAGNMDVVPAYVSMLEAATRTEPGSADLWYALGRAYLMEGARAMLPGGNAADAMPAMQKGPAALKRALQINPDHPDALAQLGGVQALMASMMQAPGMAKQGIAQMNRAVELAPDSTRVRLTRAFLGLTLPDELRNHAAEIADLDFLIEAAYWGRSSEYVRIMRADLDFEAGKPDLARKAYQLVADVGSTAAAKEAKSRIDSLDKGGVSITDIRALRSAAGAQCAMCHAGQ